MNKNFSLTVTFKPEQEHENEFLPLAERWNVGLEVHVVNSAKFVNRSYRVVRTPIANINPADKEPDDKPVSAE